MSRFELGTYPVKDTIKLLTALLEKIIRTNDRLCLESGSSNYTCFHARSIPNISVHAYLSRILKYCPCANECLLALLVYFDQMTEGAQVTKKPFHIDSYNVHRLIITGMMISSKLYSDVFFTNTRYAKVGGLPVSELNALELEFLRLNNYNLYVDIDKLQSYGDNVLSHWYQTQKDAALRKNSVDDLIVSFDQLNSVKQQDIDKHWKLHKQRLFSITSEK